MTDKPAVNSGKGPKPASVVPGINGFAALNQIVEATRACIQIHEVEKTKRATLAAYEATEVARIRAAEAVLRDYFARVFAERRDLYEGLFERMDRALDEGNGEMLHTVVTGIVDIARSSPLAEMGDLSKVRAALDDPKKVWEL